MEIFIVGFIIGAVLTAIYYFVKGGVQAATRKDDK